jgi:hypothetical protein
MRNLLPGATTMLALAGFAAMTPATAQNAT